MARAGLAVLLALSAAACSSLLDVKNPNNIEEAALANSQAADQEANGVQASTTRMLSAVSVPYAVATDELDWIGSRDAWLDLEKGAISNYVNEFTDGAFPYVGEARYLGDETIKRLEAFDKAGSLRNRASLARTYLYTAITYSTIADMFEDFAFSNKTQPAPPVGRANMGTLYDKAVDYLTKGLTIAQSVGDKNLQYALLAYRARVKHGKVAWQLVTPEGKVPANPLVNDAGANADARAALALLGAPDDKFRLVSNVESQPGINIWFEVNGRNESRLGTYFSTLKDPISGASDPTAQKAIAEFKGFGSRSGIFTITGDRELHLILAEAALAGGDQSTFRSEINAVRTLDGKPDYTGQVPALTILEHERSVQLFLMRRRLIDLYRFGLKVAQWTTDPNFKSAVNTPGLLFPIPNVERQSNPCILNPGACK